MRMRSSSARRCGPPTSADPCVSCWPSIRSSPSDSRSRRSTRASTTPPRSATSPRSSAASKHSNGGAMSLAEMFVRSGKVRDLYRLGDDRLLIVASDRLSAFDVVLPTPIPDKGKVLTGLSRFWFGETSGIVPNHLIGTDPDALPPYLQRAVIRQSERSRDDDEIAVEALRGRMMLCREV